jgi:hypothetical protein
MITKTTITTAAASALTCTHSRSPWNHAGRSAVTDTTADAGWR